MEERSRIKFNPVTKEIEVEGSEAFVRTYFQKLHRLLLKVSAGQDEEPAVDARPLKRAVRAKAASPGKSAAKETQLETIVGIVDKSGAGITTSGLKEKTGLSERQIWSITYRAQKLGRIKKTKRGLYLPA